MSQHTEIDWIFFDVGGVLVDNETFERNRKELIMRCLLHIKPISDAEYGAAHKKASAMIGNLTEGIISDILTNEEDLRLTIQKIRDLQSSYFTESVVREDALETVRVLSSRYKLGIIANQPISMRDKLTREHLLEHFAHIGLSEEQGYHKPDKRLFHAIFDQTAADPARSVMIDDNIERGLLPANQLGMKTCWFKLSEAQKPVWVNFEIQRLSDLLTIF